MLLRQLEYVLAVAELKSFTRAADKCCVTQSTLSLQIKSLEEYLNVQFFDRTSSPVKLTDEGEHLITQVREIVGKAKSFEKYAKNLTKHTIHAN
jgi:LysR family transcriptional regulator, hydrogen peroxide-inducible genes activator